MEITEWVRDHAPDGDRCPTCGQWAQLYYRTINSGMAYSAVRLLHLNRERPGAFHHLPSAVGRRSAEETKLRYWGLIESDEETGKLWRLTQKGEDWVLGRTQVPRYARIYNDELVGLSVRSRSGRLRGDIGIRDALTDKFDYDALMRGEG
jgi:hypothetical protein